jgi:hypothetical protein
MVIEVYLNQEVLIYIFIYMVELKELKFIDMDKHVGFLTEKKNQNIIMILTL